jgi:hypothetical protein
MRRGLLVTLFLAFRWGVLNKEKALLRQQQGFFFVDKRFEISNLDLIRDRADLVRLQKVLVDS